MAIYLTFSLFSFYLLSNFLTIATNWIFSEQIANAKVTNRMEKMTHLHFYFHDSINGENATSAIIAAPTDKRFAGGFGTTMIMDDPLTEGADLSSRLVGRSQGMYALASQHEVGLLMVTNFAFLEGKYNGSTLSILGRNLVSDTVREMPIVGGSGLFRFARGYVLAKTFSFSQKAGVAVVEYNVYVVHY
ncbi:dirigent protein 22-like [Malania oleifera]|uniref:dirigent protein 22-like n=1 Tax=Malania oleifera TaxID=397392 RepID=UPI0025ADEC5C|nr:dirigent protein 22-like [Malania oleifera]